MSDLHSTTALHVIAMAAGGTLTAFAVVEGVQPLTAIGLAVTALAAMDMRNRSRRGG